MSGKAENTKEETNKEPQEQKDPPPAESSTDEPKSRKKRSILDFEQRDNVGVDGAECEEFK
ncbi:hypothetical protein NQ315_004631 [Exocentrus adspersus]|uniref:Uncharacterized protein n=1 Tax=Exocentrus adspersus TaxID=1586481 RepID=A0AAV8VNU4_9CUCU|nr:hypothetical protein NQ315_004631 [Exocentrus adspersus]